MFLKQPGIADYFGNTDMQHQQHMLKSSLFELTSCCVLGRPSSGLLHLAEVHRGLGIHASTVDAWFSCLLQTIEAMDPLYDESVRLAWMAALGPGLFFLKSMLEQDLQSERTTVQPPHWYSGAADPSGPAVI